MSAKQVTPNLIHHSHNCIERYITVFTSHLLLSTFRHTNPFHPPQQYFLILIFVLSTPKFSTWFSGLPTKNSASISDRCDRLRRLYSPLNIMSINVKYLCLFRHHATKM